MKICEAFIAGGATKGEADTDHEGKVCTLLCYVDCGLHKVVRLIL